LNADTNWNWTSVLDGTWVNRKTSLQ
jgi:hypothetical protein